MACLDESFNLDSLPVVWANPSWNVFLQHILNGCLSHGLVDVQTIPRFLLWCFWIWVLSQCQERIVDMVEVLDVVGVVGWMGNFCGSWVDGTLPVLPVSRDELIGTANCGFNFWFFVIGIEKHGEGFEAQCIEDGSIFDQVVEFRNALRTVNFCAGVSANS